ncbi:alpha/beta fold hydrolase [Acidisphaera sp. L21]|uniref:alpha/beta fold hydrolase n=1 Tax=Acidisphaera sp. L21 TaxID=1641851 RepID=UPI00131CAE81|nr:alpha/beta hydrolase [Acidisphaera sp. L21]
MNERVLLTKINGVELAYLEEGSGTPVLLLHGFPDTARTWKRTLGFLASHNFQAVALFQRGYYPSAIPEDANYSIRQLAKDALGIIDRLGTTKAVIIGHDWGALAAYAAAAIAPAKVAAIIALAIPPFLVSEDSTEERQVRPHNAYLGQGEASALLLEKDDFAEVDYLYTLWSPHWQTARVHAKDVKDALRLEGRSRASVDYYRLPLPDADADAFSVKLSPPGLVIYGQDEPEVRKAIFRKAGLAFLGPVICREYPTVGHWPHLEAPDLFERDVLGFLKSNDIS